MSNDRYERLHEKLDKQHDLLITIKDEINKEISLLKLAQQKLKFMGIIALIVIVLAVGRPELIKLAKFLF